MGLSPNCLRRWNTGERFHSNPSPRQGRPSRSRSAPASNTPARPGPLALGNIALPARGNPEGKARCHRRPHGELPVDLRRRESGRAALHQKPSNPVFRASPYHATSATPPLVIQVFSPLITQSEPSRRAFRQHPRGVRPEPRLRQPEAPDGLAHCNLGSQLDFCSSDP